MLLSSTLSLLVILLSTTSASPLPTFNDIERRWSNGESEASIHAHHHIREASPAWKLSRAEPSDFAESLDARTQRRQVVYGRDMDASTLAKVRVFIAELFQSKGISGFIEARAERGIDEDEAPVLRPRGSMRYHFSSA